jgi:hypothetical protein
MVPKELTEEQKQRRVTICQDVLERQDGIFCRVITGDETRVYQYDPETQYFSAIKSRRMRWVDNIVHMEERRRAYMVSVGKPEGKRLLGRPWSRWENNIKVNLMEEGCEGMN